MWLINKPGLYRLIMRSYKPEAREFQYLIAHEVLPQIDKTGAAPTNGKAVMIPNFDFVSDRGFLFQLVRQFRKLTATGVGSYGDHKTGKVKQVYRDHPPKVTEMMGKKIIEAYAPWVASVVRRHEAEGKAMEEAKRLLAEGMDSITVEVV